jgi:transposase
VKGRPPQLHYLPPYSPDLNPNENAFAKLKAHVRKSAARTLDALDRAAANALHQFKPDECAK